MKRALATGGFVGANAVSCLASHEMQYRCLRLAPMPDADLGSAVHWEVAKELEWSIEAFRSDFYEVADVLEGGKRRREVIAAAAAVTDLAAHAQLLQDVGLTPIAIDCAPGALARCLGGFDDSCVASEPLFVVIPGASDSTLMVVRKGVPHLIRIIPVGWRHIVNLAVAKLGPDSNRKEDLWSPIDSFKDARVSSLEPAQSARQAIREASDGYTRKLAHEVSLCVHYISDALPGDMEPHVGCVIGAGRQEKLFVKALTEASDIEFRCLGEVLPSRVRSLVTELGADAPLDEWLLPLGLATYGHESSVLGVAA